ARRERATEDGAVALAGGIVSEEVEHCTVVPRVPAAIWLPRGHVGLDPRDPGDVEARTRLAERDGRQGEHGQVAVASGKELVDQCRSATTDVDDRLGRRDADEIEQLEGRLGTILVPRHRSGSHGHVAVVPVGPITHALTIGAGIARVAYTERRKAP